MIQIQSSDIKEPNRLELNVINCKKWTQEVNIKTKNSETELEKET